MKKALLALADGTIFEGRALGYEGKRWERSCLTQP
mgnify:CR=1 FL=1